MSHHLRLLITLILLTTAFNYVLAASSWEPPTSNPPGNNADAPLNVSDASQEKEGALSINDALAVFGKTFFGDSITIQDGTHGSGKLLSSDAQGLAAWKTLAELGIGSGGSGTVNTVLGAFGNWEQKAANITYRAESDGIVVSGANGNRSCSIEGYTDSSSNPTTRRIVDGTRIYIDAPVEAGFSMPVRSGDYWRINNVVSSCNVPVYWLPIESAAGGGSGGGTGHVKGGVYGFCDRTNVFSTKWPASWNGSVCTCATGYTLIGSETGGGNNLKFCYKE